MVVSRSEQSRQRKKVGDPVVQPQILENGKRAKVHAQRKFAQGASLASPALTPVKDRNKTNGSQLPAEIIPAKRPKTHDFLTFLCLRGTPILPTRLDFFSVSSSDSQNDDDLTMSSTASTKVSSKAACNSKYADRSTESAASSSRRNEVHQQNGNAGPKRRSSAPVPTSAVQALKQKYQDQRLSKQNRSCVLNKLAQRAKDKNMVRTRSGGPPSQVEQQKKIRAITKTKQSTIKPKTIVKSTSAVSSGSNTRRSTRSSGIKVNPVPDAAQKKRNGLRSGGGVIKESSPVLAKKPLRRQVAKKQACKVSTNDLSDLSSDDEPLSKKTKPVVKQDTPKKNVKQPSIATKQQAKTPASPIKMQTRSRRVEHVSSTTEIKQTSGSPQKPQARLSRKTKEVATVYMELLGKKWRDPDDLLDDDDDDDSLSLYSFSELHKSTIEKKADATKKPQKKPEKKVVTPKKKSEVVEEKKDERRTRRQSYISPPSSISSRRQSLLSSPPSQRRSLRGHLTSDPSNHVYSSESEDDEPIIKKVPIRKQELIAKKKLKKHKVEKITSVAKRTRLRIEKLNKDGKKATLNKLLEQTKRKYLSTRKSKEACIQELVQNKLERLNKEKEKEEKEMDLKLKAEEKTDSKILDIILLDKKLRTLVTQEEKTDIKTESKVKASTSKDTGVRHVAKKTASVHPKKVNSESVAPVRKMSQDRASVSLPCSPLECRTALTHPEASNQSSHCHTCGRGSESKTDETVTVEKTEPASTAVKNLNWTNVKVQNQSKPDTNCQQKSTNQPMRLSSVTDMKTFVSGLAMLQPTNKSDQLVLLAPPNSGAGTGKYIVCRKEELAALESNPSGSGVQIMVLPSGVAPEKLTQVPTKMVEKLSQGPSKMVEVKKHIETIDLSPESKHSEKSTSSSSSVSSQSSSVPKSPEEKRPIFQHRNEKKFHSKSSDAFSPENESSVYAFQMDPDDERPSGLPFRRKTKDDSPPSTHSVACSTDFPPAKNSPSNSTTRVTSTPTSSYVSQNKSSNSIAVQVNFDEVASTSSDSTSEPSASPTVPLTLRNSFECSTQTEDENEDDHLFYIPLQRGAPEPQQLIQGVEVKLGTEGPTGPNQRVIMRAKLVTKPPDRFSPALNATGMVRSSQHPTSTLGNSSKTPIVGTVQPTARNIPPSISPPKTKPVSIMPSSSGISKFQKVSVIDEKKPLTKSSPPSTPSTSQVKVMKATVSSPKSSSAKSSPTTPKSQQGGAKTTIKAQKITNKRNSAEQPSTSSTPKLSTKRPPMQRQGSSSSSGGGGSTSKFPKVLEATATPTTFPAPNLHGQLVEAPTFYPTEKDFQDPMEYIERIKPMAEQFGLCRIVPPANFKPECKVSDDMRFSAYNHYVHKMLDRWGPNVKEMTAIKKYLKSQNVAYTHPPWIGGMEIDLPKFYQTVQQLGGLMEVIEKKKWHKVADMLKIPKSAQDRVTKLDEIYCKFLLAYDTLSPDERQTLFDEVEDEWRHKELNDSLDYDASPHFEEIDECITKGRNMPLNAFYRIARNTMSMRFRTTEPAASEVEVEYWRIAQERTSHVCVHAGSIDSGVVGYGFPVNKNSPCAKHPWNLKVLSNNNGSVLRSMGPVMGVTVPTIHVGMLFSTCCWYRDPHGLPWIEYLHSGASKIWYGVPESHCNTFRNALHKIVPKHCRDQTIWLPSDTAMVPPSLLVTEGVSVCRTVQDPGQFILVFPFAFTSSISTGYLVSESVYFAQPSWLEHADDVFQELKYSLEPTMFSLERLLFCIAQDHRCSLDVLRQVQTKLKQIMEREDSQRETLKNLGLKTSERLPLPDARGQQRKQRSEDDGEHECDICRASLYLSLVTYSQEEAVYCLPHAINLLTKRRQSLKFCKFLYTYTVEEFQELIHQLDEKIEAKNLKKSQNKQSSSSSNK